MVTMLQVCSVCTGAARKVRAHTLNQVHREPPPEEIRSNFTDGRPICSHTIHIARPTHTERSTPLKDDCFSNLRAVLLRLVVNVQNDMRLFMTRTKALSQQRASAVITVVADIRFKCTVATCSFLLSHLNEAEH